MLRFLFLFLQVAFGLPGLAAQHLACFCCHRACFIPAVSHRCLLLVPRSSVQILRAVALILSGRLACRVLSSDLVCFRSMLQNSDICVKDVYLDLSRLHTCACTRMLPCLVITVQKALRLEGMLDARK